MPDGRSLRLGRGLHSRNRIAGKRVLRHVAPMIAQELQLFFDCHPISDDFEAEIVGLQDNKCIGGSVSTPISTANTRGS